MTTPKQRNERLLQVVRVLRELPTSKELSLGRWYTCGTIACAIGWSAADPWFKRLGFQLLKVRWCQPNTHRPAFKEYRDFAAVYAFFGLGADDAIHLFTAEGYRHGTSRNVIRRIEKYVRDNPA